MAEPLSDNPRKCPAPSAASAASTGSQPCPQDGAAAGAASIDATSATLKAAATAPLGDSPHPLAAERPVQFRILSIMVVTTITAICCATIATLRWVGVVFVVVALPAIIATILLVHRPRDDDASFSAGQVFALFVRLLLATFVGLSVWFFQLCILTAIFRGIALSGAAEIMPGIVALSLFVILIFLSLAGTIVFMVKTWPPR